MNKKILIIATALLLPMILGNAYAYRPGTDGADIPPTLGTKPGAPTEEAASATVHSSDDTAATVAKVAVAAEAAGAGAAATDQVPKVACAPIVAGVAAPAVVMMQDAATLDLNPDILLENNPDTVYLNIGGTNTGQLFPHGDVNALCISFNPEFTKQEVVDSLAPGCKNKLLLVASLFPNLEGDDKLGVIDKLDKFITEALHRKKQIVFVDNCASPPYCLVSTFPFLYNSLKMKFPGKIISYYMQIGITPEYMCKKLVLPVLSCFFLRDKYVQLKAEVDRLLDQKFISKELYGFYISLLDKIKEVKKIEEEIDFVSLTHRVVQRVCYPGLAGLALTSAEKEVYDQHCKRLKELTELENQYIKMLMDERHFPALHPLLTVSE